MIGSRKVCNPLHIISIPIFFKHSNKCDFLSVGHRIPKMVNIHQKVYLKCIPAKTITNADNADDLALLANTPNQAETLLHSVERAAAGIGLHVNANKTEYMCYNQTGNIATLDGASLKLVDKFTYLGSSVSSTEKDIDTRLTKTWTAIDRLSIIRKSDLTDKMKRSFFQAAVVSILLYG